MCTYVSLNKRNERTKERHRAKVDGHEYNCFIVRAILVFVIVFVSICSVLCSLSLFHSLSSLLVYFLSVCLIVVPVAIQC